MDIEAVNVIGGVFKPCDGHIDPNSLTQAIAICTRKHGAKLQQNTEVTKLDLKNDGSWEQIKELSTQVLS